MTSEIDQIDLHLHSLENNLNPVGKPLSVSTSLSVTFPSIGDPKLQKCYHLK